MIQVVGLRGWLVVLALVAWIAFLLCWRVGMAVRRRWIRPGLVPFLLGLALGLFVGKVTNGGKDRQISGGESRADKRSARRGTEIAPRGHQDRPV